MKKLVINKWKEFSIAEIFYTKPYKDTLQVPTGAMIPRKDLKEGTIPRITVSNYNNGILGYYSNLSNKNYRVYENFISVSFLGTVFYHSGKASLDMKVHCLKPINHELNVYTAMFLITVIKKAISKFAYSDQLSSTILPLLKIKLPAINNSPNWKYMYFYMYNIMTKTTINLKQLLQYDTEKSPIDISKWKRFHLYDNNLFTIDMGTKLDKAKMTSINPTINFIGRANSNNGITAFVDAIDNLPAYKPGLLTLSLEGEYLGSCFVQPKLFYTSQNVVVLIPKWNMPFTIKQFIATMIFKESRTYYKAFSNELNRHIKKDFSFYLPTTESGTPNWSYMNNYMKKIFFNTKTTFNKLYYI